MAISFAKVAVNGFDKELLLLDVNYVARPVTVNKETINGLKPNDAGRYIIPQGTLLGGKTVSLLDNPQQVAVECALSAMPTAEAVGTQIVAYAKDVKSATPSIAIRKHTDAEKNELAVITDASTGAVVVVVKTNKSGEISTKVNDVVNAINDDINANTFVKALVADGVDSTAVVAEVTTPVTLTVVERTVSGKPDGILGNSIDVTDGEATGALIIEGYINTEAFPYSVEAVRTALPKITFGRID